jgi:hypothetical protein
MLRVLAAPGAEATRIMLDYAGIPYEDYIFPREVCATPHQFGGNLAYHVAAATQLLIIESQTGSSLLCLDTCAHTGVGQPEAQDALWSGPCPGGRMDPG